MNPRLAASDPKRRQPATGLHTGQPARRKQCAVPLSQRGGFALRGSPAGITPGSTVCRPGRPDPPSRSEGMLAFTREGKASSRFKRPRGRCRSCQPQVKAGLIDAVAGPCDGSANQNSSRRCAPETRKLQLVPSMVAVDSPPLSVSAFQEAFASNDSRRGKLGWSSSQSVCRGCGASSRLALVRRRELWEQLRIPITSCDKPCR
jgi:hypothetical protein